MGRARAPEIFSVGRGPEIGPGPSQGYSRADCTMQRRLLA